MRSYNPSVESVEDFSEKPDGETVKLRPMTSNDFINMSKEELLGFWIGHCVDNKSNPEPDDYTDAIEKFEAVGRLPICDLLGEQGYQTPENPIKEISLSTARQLLTKLKNQNSFTIFSVSFVKREDGSIRDMTCRYGVTKYLAGGKKAFDDKDHDLKTVCDMELLRAGDKHPYRSISQEGLIRLKIRGQRYLVTENKEHESKIASTW